MKKIEKVLVVDDSKLARMTLTRLLKKRNLKVLEARSVSSGLEVLNSESIDAIFMDILMPEKNGFEGLRLIKSDPKFEHIPCSMYSGDLSEEAQKKAVASGAQAYLFKPASSDDLDHVMQALETDVIAEEMEKFTQSGGDVKDEDIKKEQNKHSKALVTLDSRTRNLARFVSQEKKSSEKQFEDFGEKVEAFRHELQALKDQSYDHACDDLGKKRLENDLRSQLKKMQDNMRLIFITAIAAVILAVVTIVIALVP